MPRAVLLADLFVIEGEWGWARDGASMKMHVLPLVVSFVPHAAFLALLGMRYALPANQSEKKLYEEIVRIASAYICYTIISWKIAMEPSSAFRENGKVARSAKTESRDCRTRDIRYGKNNFVFSFEY